MMYPRLVCAFHLDYFVPVHLYPAIPFFNFTGGLVTYPEAITFDSVINFHRLKQSGIFLRMARGRNRNFSFRLADRPIMYARPRQYSTVHVRFFECFSLVKFAEPFNTFDRQNIDRQTSRRIDLSVAKILSSCNFNKVAVVRQDSVRL